MEGLVIKHCFIFNPKLKSPKKKPSDDEQQDAKLLYYYPQDEELLVKRSNIGIIEGTLSFMDSFEKTNTQFLLTELNKYYFLANNYETDFIIVFILEKSSPMFSYYQNIETKKKWLKLIIDHFYNMFSLFHYTLADFFLSKENPTISMPISEEKLSIIEDFTTNFIVHFQKGLKTPFIDNVIYFPIQQQLQASLLLSVQRLNEKIPEMALSSIIYKGHVIHNQIPLEACSLIYNLFYNIFDYTPKYNTFKAPKFEVVQTINLTTQKNKESISVKTNAESTENKEKDTNEDINKDENKEKLKEQEKENNEGVTNNEINTSNSGKSTSTSCSPFRKVFAMDTSLSEFLIGIRKASGNNYHMFIPTIYIRQLDEKFKLLVYYYQGMCIFLFLNEKFDPINRLNCTLTKIEKWIDRYFKDHVEQLEKYYKIKLTQPENVTYAYCNNANKSLKLAGNFVNKKNKTLEPDKFETLQKSFLINSDVKISSLTKFKGMYVYYLNSCERNVAMIYNDSMSLPQLRKAVEENKKELFDYIYMI